MCFKIFAYYKLSTEKNKNMYWFYTVKMYWLWLLMLPIFELRGAGTFTYFHIGIWCAIRKFVPREFQRFRGMSGGALISTLAICDLDPRIIVKDFEYMCLVEYARLSTTTSQYIVECLCKYNSAQRLLYKYITDDLVSKYCQNDKLEIVAFDLVRCRIVKKSKWKNADELIKWVLASMSIPAITSRPKIIDSQLLIDPFNFYIEHKYDKKVLRCSPISEERKYSHLVPRISLPAVQSLLPVSPKTAHYLCHEGFIKTCQFLHVSVDNLFNAKKNENK